MCLTSVLYSITMHCGPFQLATTQNLSFKLKIVDVFHTNMSTKILLHCMCTEVCTDIIDSDNRSTQYTVFVHIWYIHIFLNRFLVMENSLYTIGTYTVSLCAYFTKPVSNSKISSQREYL